MKSDYRIMFSSFLLTAALVAPAAIRASSAVSVSQDEHRDDKEKRYYDRENKDYHNWDAEEDRRYREYLAEKHIEYHPFAELKEKEQTSYWKWRHDHDHDHH